MDATNDVICGTVKGYGWYGYAGCKAYAVSLSQSGFRGRKVLFVCDITDIARQALIKLGFEIYDYKSTGNNTVIERFRVLRDWLDEQQDSIRYIIHCDVRDVVVQSDPSPWMERQTAKIFGASEFIQYKNEFCNPQWVEKLYGQETLASLMEEEVICAGTIAGDAREVLKLVTRIYESSTDRFGDDQAALNVLLRTEFKDVMSIPSWREGFIATVGWWLIGGVNGNPDQPVGKRSSLAPFPPYVKDGLAYPNGSDKPFCIVHQYERGPAWVGLLRGRYEPPFPVENDEAKVIASEKRRRGGPLKYAKDGLTIDWFDMHDIG